MSSPPDITRSCPQCGARAQAAVERCWACGAELVATRSENVNEPLTENKAAPRGPTQTSSQASESPVIAQPLSRPVRFSLKFMFLITAVAAALATITVYSRGVGIVLALFVVPVTIRTLWIGSARRAAGRPLTIADRFATIGISICVIILATIAGGVTFITICGGVGVATYAYADPFYSFAGGTIFAVGVAVWIVYMMRNVGM